MVTLEKEGALKIDKAAHRILVAKLGLDGHDRGALILCKALRDAGAEVIYSGLFATPARVAQITQDEDVKVVALSLLNNAHMTLFPRVVRELQQRGIKDVLVIGGGTIPESDKPELEKAGIRGNFGSGTTIKQIVEFINAEIRRK